MDNLSKIFFKSQFRSFVLATTSVEQEGLDFHLYYHAIVHWNLPSNPVDLEQREGRVHGYTKKKFPRLRLGKGRKNIDLKEQQLA
ncbi:hypothetical protein CDG77_30600 [Nostoc sp. 'Peltigera membranacea cyanobiont' 213]|uniref:hypothetical protein n=1 Tax=Nostoc cyanobionts TaxID=3123326 RepID=UPI000B95A5CE|nr:MULTISPECIES: hypothetical protein [unclassified Nostoc]OYD87210.1 hypothetical protein CDG77_30600 [Nostoc sp. 'Peltigera membranacea cyanobiont' 213]